MIDVVMSVRNGGKYLSAAIESILNQTYPDFIFYIIDDASCDNSVDVIRSFTDKRIVLFRNHKPRGLTANLNFLLKQGKGDYIARQDADDISLPDRFEKQLNFIQKKMLDLVGCNMLVIDENGTQKKIKDYLGKNIRGDLIRFNMFPHSSWFGRRKIFEKLGGYNEKYKYAQDYEFLLRAATKFRLGLISQDLVKVRMTNKSLSMSHLKEQQRFALQARGEAIARGQYSKADYFFLLKPLFAYLLPAFINKKIYGY